MSTVRLRQIFCQALWAAIPVIALAVASLPPKVDAQDMNRTPAPLVRTTAIAVH